MSQILITIAGNTFRESVRDKVLYNLILFALIMILSSILLGQLTMGNEAKVIVDLGLSSISVFGTLIAIFIGIQLVYKELEKRTAYFLLAKPVNRRQLILGKYIGLLATLFVNVAIMTVGLLATLVWQSGVNVGSLLRVLPAVFLIFLALALTTAIALLFSSFSTPALSAAFTFFLWVIGHFNRDLLEFGNLTKSAAVEVLCKGLYYLLPNFSNFTWLDSRNIIQAAAYGQSLNAAAIGWVLVYCVLYCSALLGLAMAVFSRRDLK
jgi:ABC-type transport system involved in multi-copper enzyme maturation permease subunit